MRSSEPGFFLQDRGPMRRERPHQSCSPLQARNTTAGPSEFSRGTLRTAAAVFRPPSSERVISLSASSFNREPYLSLTIPASASASSEGASKGGVDGFPGGGSGWEFGL